MSDEPVFITTDRPVIIANHRHECFGIKTPATFVLFPLCPTRVLMMDDRLDEPVDSTTRSTRTARDR